MPTIFRSASRCSRPAGHDALLASIGRVFHADTRLHDRRQGSCRSRRSRRCPRARAATFAIAVVGAHLSGMALNGELKALGGRLLEAAITAPDYRLYALPTTPPKPGMLRVEPGKGAAIELEVWALPPAAFGRFVAAMPPPLSIGTDRVSPTAAASRASWSKPRASRARAIFRLSAAGGRTWRKRRRCDANVMAIALERAIARARMTP